MRTLLPLLFLCACGGAGTDDPDEVELPEPAPLTSPSDGACPDMSSNGLTTFSSAGEDRDVAIYLPSGGTEGKPVIFVWHGLTSPDATFTDSPATDMALALDLEALAEDKDAIVVVPAAIEGNLLAVPVYLWGFLFQEDADLDLALHDDLRGCVVDELGADVRRISHFGFSGGGLWVSYLVMQRSDTMATVVSASGGTGQASTLLAYQPPADKTPAMLIDGGDNDVWPDPALALVRFNDATADLGEHLSDDGHYVVRCTHDRGHDLPSDLWNKSTKWMLNHTYGAPSPYELGDNNVPNGCEGP